MQMSSKCKIRQFQSQESGGFLQNKIPSAANLVRVFLTYLLASDLTVDLLRQQSLVSQLILLNHYAL